MAHISLNNLYILLHGTSPFWMNYLMWHKLNTKCLDFVYATQTVYVWWHLYVFLKWHGLIRHITHIKMCAILVWEMQLLIWSMGMKHVYICGIWHHISPIFGHCLSQPFIWIVTDLTNLLTKCSLAIWFLNIWTTWENSDYAWEKSFKFNIQQNKLKPQPSHNVWKCLPPFQNRNPC